LAAGKLVEVIVGTVIQLPTKNTEKKIKWAIFSVVSEISGTDAAEMHETFEERIGSVEIPVSDNTGLPNKHFAVSVLPDVRLAAEDVVLKVVDNYSTIEVIERSTNQTWAKFRREADE
jgi:hypothetical protein